MSQQPNNLPKFVQTDDPSFVRDTSNRALLNKDRAALLRHRAVRLKRDKRDREIDALKAEVSELKALVQRFLHQ